MCVFVFAYESESGFILVIRQIDNTSPVGAPGRKLALNRNWLQARLSVYPPSPAKLLLYVISNGQEMAMLKNDVNLSKITFSVL